MVMAMSARMVCIWSGQYNEYATTLIAHHVGMCLQAGKKQTRSNESAPSFQGVTRVVMLKYSYTS